MLDYSGKIAGIVSSDTALKYVVAMPIGEALEIRASGEIELDEPGEERFQPLLGSKCIYGINCSQYHRKRLYLADDLAASDPEQFFWELARSSADQVENYLYSLLKLQPTDKGIHIECLAINRKAYSRIGELFERHHLTLDKMVFEPEAHRQGAKSLVRSERALLLHVDNDTISLQMYRHGHLVAMEMIRSANPDLATRPEAVIEEIGVHLMSVFGGRPLRRSLLLITAGDATRVTIGLGLKKELPYDFTIQDFPFDRLKILPGALLNQQLHYYFSPLTLCYAYNKSEKCASLPEKNAVLS